MDDERLDLLAHAEIEIEGRMPYSSNATFLVELRTDAEVRGRDIYKPGRGERPLWDFPPGLYRREVAAYRLSVAVGLPIVPPTVLREGPVGEGSLQWFVDARFDEHYFTLFESRPDLHEQFRDVALFDVVANNTDRKSGHCLVDSDERIWAIDNGLCFSADFKLRTVIWEFGGEPIPERLIEPLARVVVGVTDDVAELLHDEEVEAIVERASMLVESGHFPVDSSGHRYPWPMV
ncbi:MAG: SCO1664 family protein [Ilumatobacteraceae bacterium]